MLFPLLQASSSSGLEWAIVAAIVVVGLVVLALWVWSIIWVYNDAEKRGTNGVLVALLVALVSWPLGLIVWLILRPDVSHRSA